MITIKVPDPGQGRQVHYGVRQCICHGRREDHQDPARANAIAGRWIAGARRECLDRTLITGERHLRLVLTEYVGHYNSHRPHRALQPSPPAGRLHPCALGANVRVLRRDRLGGLIHEYSQVA
jgi:putative transposase